MARYKGHHRLSTRTKIATLGIGLVMAGGVLVVVTTTGDPGSARADGADKSQFVDITTVQPNLNEPRPQGNASTGTFTVDCGNNEEGHFNPDNFIAQPGVRNGAQHLHDYVGNLTTNADSNNKSLAAGDTTCKNGDKSTYYWPVMRINQEEEEEQGQGNGGNQGGAKSAKEQQVEAQRNQDKQVGAVPRVECPDVASQLPAVPAQAQAEVDRNLDQLEQQIKEADARLVSSQGQGGPNFINNAILGPLADKRKAAIDRIAIAIGRNGERPQGLERLAPCALKDQNNDGVDNGDENSDGDNNNGEDENGNQDDNAELPGQDEDNNVGENEGEILRPEVDITFHGSAVGKVTAMPKFLRMLTGNAKVTAAGGKNAIKSFTCEGFEDKVRLDKYVICPEGSKVMRISDFPSCWDGKNIDSADHRSHVAFPDQNGKCKNGFKAIPQLRITLKYDVPRAVQEAGLYAIDSFPEEDHNPKSDHNDFANVMSQKIMNRLVNCVNTGKTCSE